MGKNMVEEVMDYWEVEVDTFKIGGVRAGELSWGMWGLITGIGEGALSCPSRKKTQKIINELRTYP